MPSAIRGTSRLDTQESTSTDPAHGAACFYQFLGAHSLLIGLLPFFLPVFLWQHGLDLAGLSLLIGVSGVSFVAVLGLWQSLARHCRLKHLISITFALELLLVVVVGLITTVPGAALFTLPGDEVQVSITGMLVTATVTGLANGLYNAFFWTTQRTLFLQQLRSNDTGRQYGNFQIFVTLFLKLGILLGGFLLETGGFVWLLALSAGAGFASSGYLAARLPQQRMFAATATPDATVTLADSLAYHDNRSSRTVFIIDGLFLYLESHYWTLTLFLVVREDYNRLGIAVVVLALVFAVVFYLIKNRIDQLAVSQIYRAAVWLYVASWLLRFTLTGTSSGPSLWVALIVITFCSSFFRLAFNKRFFDVARRHGGVRYILIKSYCSQAWLGLAFVLLGLLLLVMPVEHETVLPYLYLPAALLSMLYLRYAIEA